MSFNWRSSYFLVLITSLSAVTLLGMFGFLNYVYADNSNMSEQMGVNANVNASSSMAENMNMTSMNKVLSPLQQFKSGVLAKDVSCNEGFTLVIKAEDGSPACVTSQNAPTLIARGWGTAP